MATITWAGTTSTNADLAANWVGNTAPTSSDVVYFNSSSALVNQPIFSTNKTFQAFHIGSSQKADNGPKINGVTITLTGDSSGEHLIIEKAESLEAASSSILKFTGAVDSDNTYVKFNAGTGLDQTTLGMFQDSSSRTNMTFQFEPGTNITLELANGVYPNLQGVASSNTCTFSATAPLNTVSSTSYQTVDILNLTLDANFKISPARQTKDDLDKIFNLEGNLIIQTDTFFWGNSTVAFTPQDADSPFPVSGVYKNTTNSGGSYDFGNQTTKDFNAKYNKIIIRYVANKKFILPASSILVCNHVEIESGGRLYGPDTTAIEGAEIHSIQRPTIHGDWNFTQVADGIYRTRKTLLPQQEYHDILSTNRSNYGSNGEVLSINSGGKLEWSATAGGTGFSVSDITGATELTSGLASTDELVLSDAGALKRMDISVLQTYMQSNLTFTTNTDVDVSVANLKTRLAGGFGSNAVQIGDSDDVVTIGNDLIVTGNLTVSGTTTTLNTATLDVEDLNITVGKAATTSAATDGAGLTFGAWSSGTIPTLTWVHADSRLAVNKALYSSGGFVGSLTGNVTGNAATATTATNANQLNATDDRNLAPEDLSYANDFQAFFTSKQGLEDGSTNGTNYMDAIVLNTYSDSTGHDANLLAFDKSTKAIYHYQADQAATNWGTAKQLAYTDSDITGNAATTTLASDNGTESHFLTFSDAATGSQALKTDDTLTYIPSSGRLTTNVFVGELAGNVTGNVTGDLTGNADTVTNGVYTTGDQSIAGVKTFTSIPLLKAGLDLVNPNLTGAMGITLQNNDGKFLLYTDEGQLIIKDFLVDTGASTDGTDTFPFKLQSGAATDTFVIKTGGRVDVSGALYAGSFVGDVTGNVSGTAATVTGATQSAITTVGNAFTITGNDSASLNITAIDNGASPAQTTFINMTGYDDRGQGIRFFDTNSSGEEWFAGIRYSGGFDEYTIGYDASGGQSEYVANALLQVNKNGNVTASTFVGALTGNADTVTNGVYTSGNQTIGGIKTLSSYMVLTGDTTAAPVDLTSVHLGEDGGQLEVRTQYGTIQLGGVNSSYNHIEGSAGRFYFNKPVVINGNGTYGTLSSYSTEDLILTTNNGTETRMTIKQDTGNVGIGTTSPVSLLHLKKNAYNFVDGTQDEDGDFHLMIKSDEASSVGKAVSIGFAQSNDATTVGAKISHVIEGSYSQGSLVFSTNSTASAGDTTAERMRITSAGNVGIGTTTPAAKLQVVQPDASWTILAGADVNALSLTDNTRKFMRLGMPHYDTDEQSFSLITGDSDNGVNRLYLGGGTGIGNAATQIYFRTSANSTTTTGTTRMTVASDGKVGIGTESPSSELEVAGNTSGNVQITIDNDNTAGLGTYALQEDGATTGIFQYRGSTNGTLPNTVRVGSNVAGGSLAFTYADGTTGMYMQGSDGKVGIGTTAPAVNLHVSHATDPKIRVQDSSHNYSATLSGYSGGAYLGLGDMDNGESEWMLFGAFSNINNLNTRTRDFHLYGTNTTKGFYFDESAGRFGIGTTTPEDGILEVVAPLDPSGSDTTFTYATTLKLDVEDSDSAEGPAILFRHGATGDHNAADYYFQVNGDGGGMSAHEYANNWGYAKWFHGAGADGYKPLMKISYGGSTNAGAAMYGTLQLTSATAAWDVFDGTHTGLDPTSFTTGVYLNAGGNSYINGGNLGIGTTSPSTKLHLSDSAEVALSVDSSNSIGSTISLDATATGGDEWRLISAADGAGTTDGTGAFGLYNMDVSAYRLVVEGTTGHVGIGTATPSEMLHVESADEVLGLFKSTDAGAGIKIDTPDDGYAVVFFSEAGTNKWSLGKLASNSDKFSIYDEVNTTPRLVIDTSGNVGIGTTSPTYKLHVVGSFTATTKEFTIPHPSKKGMTLSHGSLEGPEHGVYIRGKSKDKVFYLPDYWKDLVHEDSITVQLTPIGKSENLYVVDYNTEYIEVENDVEYFYYVQAERKDVDKLEVEF